MMPQDQHELDQLSRSSQRRRMSRRGFLGRAAIASLGTLGALGASTRRTYAGRQPDVELDVDFGSPVSGVPSMSGILQGLSPTQPPDEVIAPLKPNLWRVGGNAGFLAVYDRVVGFGARFILVLSDTWGYHAPWPYDNYTAWENHVSQWAQASAGKVIVWDIWNEPNAPVFWQGTQAQFFETYRRAYNVLRKELGGDTVIGGPSLNQYDHAYLAAFADSCLANNCEVNALSWHELQSTGVRIYPIADHLADAASSFVDNPNYANLNIQEVHVNEAIGPQDQYRPAEMWGSFYYLEVGGADGACKACWKANDGTSNCSNNTLDGLVFPATAKLRAGWWAYKLYADGVPTRVLSVSSEKRVVGLASSASSVDNQAQILIGYFESGSSPASVDIDLGLYNLRALPFLRTADSVLLSLYGIPNSDEAELSEPEFVDDAVLPIADDGSAFTMLPSLALHEGLVVLIGSAGGKRRRQAGMTASFHRNNRTGNDGKE